LPEAAAVAGINYVDLCVRIIELSRLRQNASPARTYGGQARGGMERAGK
jgi:hypothetical protein